MARWSSVWTRRCLLAAVLIGAVIIPGYANESATQQCAGSHCGSTGTIRWVQPLTGSWTAESGVAGYESSAWFGMMAPGGTPKAVAHERDVTPQVHSVSPYTPFQGVPHSRDAGRSYSATLLGGGGAES